MQASESWNGPKALWANDPAGRFHQRFWVTDGWTNVVRDRDGVEQTDPDSDLSEEAYPPPLRSHANARNATVLLAGLAAMGTAAWLWGRRTGTESLPGPDPMQRDEARTGSTDTRTTTTRTIAGMTEVPTQRWVDFTPASPVSIKNGHGAVRIERPLTELEYADMVPDSVRRIPDAVVFTTPMRN